MDSVNEFEKRGIIVYSDEGRNGESVIEPSDYYKCNVDEDSSIILFEYKKQELLCPMPEEVFEKLVNDWIDWDLIDFNFGIGEWEQASNYFNHFGIFFRNMAFKY
jgi:hypothetical protein